MKSVHVRIFSAVALPIMALSFSVPQAAAILMPVLLLMGIPGMAEFRKDFDLKLLKFLIPCGLVGIVVGALPPKWLGAILTITLGFTSFISRAGGPPINANVIPLRLSPIKFTATLAFYFFVINLAGAAADCADWCAGGGALGPAHQPRVVLSIA